MLEDLSIVKYSGRCNGENPANAPSEAYPKLPLPANDDIIMNLLVGADVGSALGVGEGSIDTVIGGLLVSVSDGDDAEDGDELGSTLG